MFCTNFNNSCSESFLKICTNSNDLIVLIIVVYANLETSLFQDITYSRNILI